MTNFRTTRAIHPRSAEAILTNCNALDEDFHALRSSSVESLLAWADHYRYRAPRNASGSRARYYHAYLTRVARRAST